MPPCPKCKQRLRRVRRKPRERLLSYIFPVMRYQCFNSACRWQGLRFSLRAHPWFGEARKGKGSGSGDNSLE